MQTSNVRLKLPMCMYVRGFSSLAQIVHGIDLASIANFLKIILEL